MQMYKTKEKKTQPIQQKKTAVHSINQYIPNNNNNDISYHSTMNMCTLNPTLLRMRSKPQSKNADIEKVSKVNNTGIPNQMKENFEAHSGFSFDDVKVHYNSDKPAQLQASAYTQGKQQKQGIVKPTFQLNGIDINNDSTLEKGADVYEKKAAPFNHEVTQHLKVAQGKFGKVVQREALLGGLSGEVAYTTTINKGKISAYKMVAKNIQRPNKVTFPWDDPMELPNGWEEEELSKKGYVRMHLLNANLGGTGHDIKNLAPGSHTLNSSHSKDIERKLIDHLSISDLSRKIISYSVECLYWNLGDYRDYTLHEIRCKYELNDGKGLQELNIQENL